MSQPSPGLVWQRDSDCIVIRTHAQQSHRNEVQNPSWCLAASGLGPALTPSPGPHVSARPGSLSFDMEPASTVGSGAKENSQPFWSPTRLLPQRLLICYQPLPQSSGAGEWQGFFLLEFDTSFLPAAAPRNPPLGRREAGRGGAETSGNFFRPLLPRLPGNDPGDGTCPR